jgi:hypothetical protein
MLFEPVQPVPAAAPTTGLVATATTPTDPGRWEQGFAWKPERCPTATGMEPWPCDGAGLFGPAVGDGDDGVVYHRPVAFRVEETCATRGGDNDISRVRRQALAVTSFMAARELETGALSRANPYATPETPGVAGTVNAHLASPATVVEGGVWDPVAGLGRIEQLAREDALGQDPFIHMPVGFVPLMGDAVVREGKLLRTKTGAFVVADAGYSGQGVLSAGTSEVQTVTITGGPTGGTFTLTFDGETTAPIAFDATAATVAAALAALPNTAPSWGTVTGVNGGPYTVTFDAELGDVPQMTGDGAGLTGGAAPAVAVATTTPGVAPARAAGAWLYATGPVVLRLGDVVTYEEMVWRENRYVNTADRLFATQYDPCNQHALSITSPTPA